MAEPIIPELDTDLDIMSLVESNEKNIQKTPLQKMEESKQLGMPITKDTFQEHEDGTKRMTVLNDDRMESIQETLDGYDEMIEKAKLIKVLKKPKSQEEMVAFMDEFEKISLEELKAAIAANENDEANEQTQELLNVQLTDEEISSIINKSGNGNGNKDLLKNSKFMGFKSDSDADDSEEAEEDDERESDEYRAKQIQIIIDKTGKDKIEFTEEEKSKIAVSESIELREVSTLDLKTTKMRKSTRNFADMISDDTYNTYGVRTSMAFPCSKFKAYLTGLSYGELGDIALSYDNEGYDELHKKLSVIYNKMVNPSCGKFKDFDDFLHRFAYVDINLAVYALYIGSTPEEKTITMKCNADGCGENFEHKFLTRELIQYQDASQAFLDSMEEIASATPEQAVEMNLNASHMVEKMVELPVSKIVIKLSHVSCYDYLHKIMNNVADETFAKNHPDDTFGVLQSSAIILPVVSGFAVPTDDGYESFDEFDDILEMCYRLPIDDFHILISLVQKYLNDYSITFGVRNVVCPHCGQKTDFVPIDINQQVFRLYQTQLSTSVNVKNLPRL